MIKKRDPYLYGSRSRRRRCCYSRRCTRLFRHGMVAFRHSPVQFRRMPCSSFTFPSRSRGTPFIRKPRMQPRNGLRVRLAAPGGEGRRAEITSYQREAFKRTPGRTQMTARPMLTRGDLHRGPEYGRLLYMRVRIRACASVGSLVSVPWPEHTSPKCTEVTELSPTGVRTCSH